MTALEFLTLCDAGFEPALHRLGYLSNQGIVMRIHTAERTAAEKRDDPAPWTAADKATASILDMIARRFGARHVTGEVVAKYRQLVKRRVAWKRRGEKPESFRGEGPKTPALEVRCGSH